MNARVSFRRAARIALAVAALSTPLAALAQEGHCEGMHEDPLGTLDDCVTHHWAAGEILSDGVYRSLLGRALEAQAAVGRGDVVAAARILEAFTLQVEALAGKQIVGDAVHLAHHAELAIAQIEGSARG